MAWHLRQHLHESTRLLTSDLVDPDVLAEKLHHPFTRRPICDPRSLAPCVPWVSSVEIVDLTERLRLRARWSHWLGNCPIDKKSLSNLLRQKRKRRFTGWSAGRSGSVRIGYEPDRGACSFEFGLDLGGSEVDPSQGDMDAISS
jgi:hypothetical protein